MADKIENGQASIESLSLKIGNESAHYLKAGSGPPLVLVHGGASDSRDWTNTMNTLAHRYSLYAPDLIGYGRNNRNADGYYLSDFSGYLNSFIEALGLGKTVLVGHSLGGRISLEMAIRYPEKVSKLVLVDSSGLGKASFYGNLFLTVLWAIRKLLRRPQPFPRFRFRENEDTSWRCASELRHIKASTLIVWKRHDPFFPLTIARRAAKLIPGARLEVMPGYGHAPHKENPDGFNRILLDFLARDDYG